uniref:Uncharacterized protein n=1 Tax=Siphoviridae sp. ctPui28 TaxID=2825488 RepID=A0A8S5PDJ5_9CAUD|nr:MAG TPA: hypothetical protein [Siphoviridae sp. ctPui28]
MQGGCWPVVVGGRRPRCPGSRQRWEVAGERCSPLPKNIR